MSDDDPQQQPGPAGPAPADQDWFGGRRWTGIGALAVLLLIVVSAVVVLLATHHHQPAGTQAAPAASTQPTTAASSSVSPLPTAVPSTAPAGTAWQLYQTVAVPVVPGAGPAHITRAGAIATGYAHTPDGALVAAVNESARYALAPDNLWQQAATAMVDPGPGLTDWRRLRAKNPYGPGGAGEAGSDGRGGAWAQTAGFQFVSYTPSDAVIDVISTNPNGGFQTITEHVTWASGDWKLVLAAGGGTATNAQSASSTAGFIAWKGV